MSTAPQSPDTTHTTPIVHALLKASRDSNTLPSEPRFYPYPVYFEPDAWPLIARELINEGYGWPALSKLANVEVPTELVQTSDTISSQIEQLTGELLEQTATDISFPYWDLLCAIAGRQWELEKLERGMSAEPWAYASIFDAMWWTTREIPDDQSTPGTKLIWRGMGLKEVIGFQDIDKEMTELLEETQKLHIPVPFDMQTCKKILEATY